MIYLNVIHQFDSIALQFFDYYLAYQQSLARLKNYHAETEITFNQPPDKKFINIYLVPFDQVSHFQSAQADLVLIDNAGESLEVASNDVRYLLENNLKFFFLCGAFVSQSLPWADQIIPYNHNLHLFSDCVSKPFYPQHYDLKDINSKSKAAMCFINGQNRTWRNYFLTLLKSANLHGIYIKNSIATQSSKLLDCAFESSDDSTFRQYVNDLLPNVDEEQEQKIKYYKNSIAIGADGKFGKIPPGYFLIDEYYLYQCIIYPEASWINDHLFLTEKTWKCCLSKTIPWPISGRNFHTMMNEHGFLTARNLLPPDLQTFDSISDHSVRYVKQLQSIQWAYSHPEIWSSSEADYIRENNFNRFWINDINLVGVKKFDSIVRNCRA